MFSIIVKYYDCSRCTFARLVLISSQWRRVEQTNSFTPPRYLTYLCKAADPVHAQWHAYLRRSNTIVSSVLYTFRSDNFTVNIKLLHVNDCGEIRVIILDDWVRLASELYRVRTFRMCIFRPSICQGQYHIHVCYNIYHRHLKKGS